MIGQLIEMAFAHKGVREVVAHTQPDESAATRLIRRLGLELNGVAYDRIGDEISRSPLRRAHESAA